MLDNPKEIAIASKSNQTNIRDPRRSRDPFFNILEDFLQGVDLSGRYVDLGPGHLDLAECQTAIGHVLDLQRRCFESLGYQTIVLSEKQTRRYGIHGNVANSAVFTRKLDWRPKS